MVRTRQEILDTLRAGKEASLEKYPIRRIALFGSWARGEQDSGGDVDILVDVDPAIGLGFVSPAGESERLLGHRVDLVPMRFPGLTAWAMICPSQETGPLTYKGAPIRSVCYKETICT